MDDSSELPSPFGNGRRSDDDAQPRSRRKRRIVAAVAVLLLAFWGYALWYSLNRPEPEPLDQASHDDLEALCIDMALDLRALDQVTLDDSFVQRADRVRAENEVFAAFVDDAGEVEPVDPEGRTALTAWLDDWDTLIDARATFADEMAAERPRALVVPAESNGRPVTVRMNEYARDHDLDVCSPIRLLAEIVDGERLYPELELSE